MYLFLVVLDNFHHPFSIFNFLDTKIHVYSHWSWGVITIPSVLVTDLVTFSLSPSNVLEMHGNTAYAIGSGLCDVNIIPLTSTLPAQIFVANLDREIKILHVSILTDVEFEGK